MVHYELFWQCQLTIEMTAMGMIVMGKIEWAKIVTATIVMTMAKKAVRTLE